MARYINGVDGLFGHYPDRRREGLRCRPRRAPPEDALGARRLGGLRRGETRPGPWERQRRCWSISKTGPGRVWKDGSPDSWEIDIPVGDLRARPVYSVKKETRWSAGMSGKGGRSKLKASEFDRITKHLGGPGEGSRTGLLKDPCLTPGGPLANDARSRDRACRSLPRRD
jgi:hypothetical protein